MALANPIALARLLTPVQQKTFVAAFLGWTLDAFDFFIVTFIVKDIAEEFHRTAGEVIFAITLTLMLRWVGALLFGILADKYGRRGPLMINILLYSGLELLSGFAPTFTIFLVLRGLYGIAMGGEWGVGAALALETMPAEARGFFSGLLQEGYALGYLIAAIVFFLVEPHLGWRAMFFVGATPALLVLYIRSQIPESDAWRKQKTAKPSMSGDLWRSFKGQPMLFAYAILLMAAFNFMSHGSQDLYPTFLRIQKSFNPGTVSAISIVANVGAILGGVVFGAVSQQIGRRRAIVTAALVGILAIPVWVFSPSAVVLAAGAFVLQFFVQGAWGVIPVHLNELSPGEVRGTFPGFVYQLGNFISAFSLTIESLFATKTFPLADGGADYGKALATIMLVVFLAVAFITAIGKERRGIDFASD